MNVAEIDDIDDIASQIRERLKGGRMGHPGRLVVAENRPDARKMLEDAGFDVPTFPKRQDRIEPRTSFTAAPKSSAIDARKMLEDAGFDLYGRPDTSEPAQPSVKTTYDIAKRAKSLGDSGLVGSVVEGMPIIGPLAQKGAAATNAAIDPWLGRGSDLSFGDRYAKNLEILREADRLRTEKHPYLTPAANVAGAVLGTAPFAANRIAGRALGTIGSAIGARLYGALGGGAAIGATDAALRGENPVAGGALGAAGGALGVFGGEAAGRTLTRVSEALRGGQGPLATVNTTARGWLATALANETPASIAAARARMGAQGFAADLNAPMTDLAIGLANRSEPPASAAIADAYRARQAAERQVTEDALNRNIGPNLNIEHFKDFITENRAAAADPLYEQWRSMRVHPTQELKDLMPVLNRLGLTKDAQEHALMRNVPFDRNFFTTGQQKNYPTTESWDMIKRAIDARIESAYGAGNKTKAADLIALKNRMIDEIGKTPAGQIWQQARNEFAERSALLDQIQAGRDTFLGGRSGISPDQMREEINGLSTPERLARIVGLRSAAADAMGATQNGDATLRNKFLAPNNQEKVRMLIGDQPAENLFNTIEQQSYRNEIAKMVNPRAGSATQPRAAASKALEAPALGTWDPSLTKPLSWIPPSWIDAVRPSTIAHGALGASYADARQQLAPALLTTEGPGLDRLLSAIQAESSASQRSIDLGDRVRALTTLGVGSLSSEELRRREPLRITVGPPALTVPAQ